MSTSVVHEYPARDIADDPVDAGGQASASECGARLDAPVPLGRGERIEPELLSDLFGRECTLNVLLVGKDEQRGAGESCTTAPPARKSSGPKWKNEAVD